MTQHPSDREARLSRALAHADTHGGDTRRWPADARALASEFASDPRFAAALESAAALDFALAAAPAPTADDALTAALLAAAPTRAASSSGRPSRAGLFGFLIGRPLVPASALAGFCALGFAAGLATAAPGAATQEEALIYADAALALALEQEDAPWAEVE